MVRGARSPGARSWPGGPARQLTGARCTGAHSVAAGPRVNRRVPGRRRRGSPRESGPE